MLENAKELTFLLSEIDPTNQSKIESLIVKYHKSLDFIQTNLKEHINQCPESLLLPLQSFASSNQYISKNAQLSHKQIIGTLKKNQSSQNNQQIANINVPKSGIIRSNRKPMIKIETKIKKEVKTVQGS